MGYSHAMAIDVRSAAQAFRARESARRDAREQKARETLGRVVSAIRSLLGPGERAWVFGSLAAGYFGEHSDVDVALDGVAREKLAAIERAVAATSNSPVDLVDLQELPPAFRARIEHEGIRIE